MNLTKTSKTYNLKDKNWILIDATDKTLGRLSTKIADLLRGKDKAIYTPNTDCGSFVIVINSEKIKLTGAKLDKKIYYKDSKYIGGLKQKTAKKALEADPTYLLYTAVKGMLPKTKLSDAIIKKLKIYKGSEHNHQAQKPINSEE